MACKLVECLFNEKAKSQAIRSHVSETVCISIKPLWDQGPASSRCLAQNSKEGRSSAECVAPQIYLESKDESPRMLFSLEKPSHTKVYEMYIRIYEIVDSFKN